MKELLPLGTVVRPKEATKSLMIIGTMQVDEDGTTYDYISCMFPEGYLNDETFFTFNHEDIEEVLFIGCVNAESQAYTQLLRNQGYFDTEE